MLHIHTYLFYLLFGCIGILCYCGRFYYFFAHNKVSIQTGSNNKNTTALFVVVCFACAGPSCCGQSLDYFCYCHYEQKVLFI